MVPAILAAGLVLGVAAMCIVGPRRAQALPSYARQTGQQCAACHNGFPELTPYGRQFKLNGYTFGGGDPSAIPPISAMTVPSFTHTEAGQPGGAAPHFGQRQFRGHRSCSTAQIPIISGRSARDYTG